MVLTVIDDLCKNVLCSEEEEPRVEDRVQGPNERFREQIRQLFRQFTANLSSMAGNRLASPIGRLGDLSYYQGSTEGHLRRGLNTFEMLIPEQLTIFSMLNVAVAKEQAAVPIEMFRISFHSERRPELITFLTRVPSNCSASVSAVCWKMWRR